MPLVSFIVPVCNSENYLRDCLDSILQQSVKDIEVICINDGSTDNSKQILNSYATQDERVQVLHFSNNRGSGVARNAGINQAAGKYLRMVDADDYIPLDSTAKLVKIASKHDSDFVRGGFEKCHHTAKTPLKKGGRFPNELIINASIETERKLWYFDQHTTYLFSSEIVKNSAKSQYSETMRNGEDVAFIIGLIPFMKKVSLIPETVYYYRQNPLSLMRGKKNREYYLNLFQLYAMEYDYLNPKGYQEQVDHFLFYHFLKILPYIVLPSIPENLDDEDAIHVLNSLKIVIDTYNLKRLCLTQKYPWQTGYSLPLLSKITVILLTTGYTEDALQLLKKFRKDELKIQMEQKKISTLLKSTSWRITQPMRSLIQLFK